MKKAKLMLSVLGIVTICASITAFKAKTLSEHFVFTGPLGSGECPNKVIGTAIASGTANVAASSTVIRPCPDNLTVAVEN